MIDDSNNLLRVNKKKKKFQKIQRNLFKRIKKLSKKNKHRMHSILILNFFIITLIFNVRIDNEY